eukprot:gene17632-12622_t
MGERVRLAPTFAENQGDGWCLGSVKDQRVGVVVAIGGQSINHEQRNILVYCAASTTKLALFKASWLERAPPTMKHCVGDLVQLNPTTTCRPVDRTMVAGKCLGRPDQGDIGVVTAIGPMVAGIQRNVQVALLTSSPSAAADDSSSTCARVSLYCASKLVRAEPWLSTHPQVTAALVQAVERAARKPNGTSRVNGSVLVDRLGIHVWGKMLSLVDASTMLGHVYGWMQACASMDLQASLVNKEVADYYVFGALGEAKALAWNCSLDAWGRNQERVLPAPLRASDTVVTDADTEKRFNATIVSMGPNVTTTDDLLGPALGVDGGVPSLRLQREESAQYWSNDRFEPITDFYELVRLRDEVGNSAAHQL